MTGSALLSRSSVWLSGFRHGYRAANRKPWRMILAWVISGILLGSSVAVTVTTWEIALQSTSIGEIVQQTRVGRVAAYLRIYKPKR